MISVLLICLPRNLPHTVLTPCILLYWLISYIPKGTQKSGMVYSTHGKHKVQFCYQELITDKTKHLGKNLLHTKYPC